MPTRLARIGSYTCGPGQPLLLIAGPCVIESERLCLQIAKRLCQITQKLPLQLVFKASYDKANRTSGSAFRGLGREEGLASWRKCTTPAEYRQRPTSMSRIMPGRRPTFVIYCIPAFLARQTDLLAAAAATGRPVNVKKGQFMAPGDMKHVVSKLNESGCSDVFLCERGTFFGYGRLVNDMRAIPTMREFAPVIFDATHSVQEPGGLGAATGGNREMVEPLARAAVAIGVDGLFFETHPEPDKSPSDGPNMIPLDRFSDLLHRLLRLRETVESFTVSTS